MLSVHLNDILCEVKDMDEKNCSAVLSENTFFYCVFFLLIMAAGIVLRMIIHTHGPIGYDEICTWAFSKRESFLDMWVASSSDPTPPLYYACVHLMIRLLGDATLFMRLPSVMFGLLTLPATLLCMRFGGFRKRDQLSAMLIVAFSSMLIYYSQELRAYSMLAFLGTVSTSLLYKALQTSSLRYCCAFSLSTFLLAYTHRYGYFLICAHVLCSMLYKNKKVFLVSIVTFTIILLLLLIEILQGRFAYSESVNRTSDVGSVFALLYMLNIGALQVTTLTGRQPGPHVFFSNEPFYGAVAVAGMMLFCVIAIGGFYNYRLFNKGQRRFLEIIVICIVVPSTIALIGGSTMVPKPQWLLRGLIYIWPLYYMLTAAVCSKMRHGRFWLTIIIVLNIVTLYPYYTTFKRDDAVAIEKLNSLAGPDDLIIVYPWYLYQAINFYYKGEASKTSLIDSDSCDWIDLDALDKSTRPLHPKTFPINPVHPSFNGDIYLFWRIHDMQNHTCMHLFQSNVIMYNPANTHDWIEIDYRLLGFDR
jgi:uncharacterized membrane protein